jgi:hypothetical protein
MTSVNRRPGRLDGSLAMAARLSVGPVDADQPKGVDRTYTSERHEKVFMKMTSIVIAAIAAVGFTAAMAGESLGIDRSASSDFSAQKRKSGPGLSGASAKAGAKYGATQDMKNKAGQISKGQGTAKMPINVPLPKGKLP